jgi:hypothetical protein
LTCNISLIVGFTLIWSNMFVLNSCFINEMFTSGIEVNYCLSSITMNSSVVNTNGTAVSKSRVTCEGVIIDSVAEEKYHWF